MYANPHEPMRRTKPTMVERDEGWFTVRGCRAGRSNARRLAIAESAGIR